MKIVFMGSAEFAIAPLSMLLRSNYEVKLVITQPDKPAGRGQKVMPCPLGEWAEANQLVVSKPSTLKNNKEIFTQLKSIAPDVIVVVAYGKLLPKEILDIPKHGCVNIHASLLPKYRGAAPINWAIINGEKKTGVTTMFINEKMDEGDILLQCSTDIQDHDTTETLHDHLTILGADLLLKTLERLEKTGLKGIKQDLAKATYAPILKKEDGLINWSLSASEIYNRIRGLQPWPKAYTHFDGKQFTIFDAAVVDEKANFTPGTIIDMDKGIMVATGSGRLFLLEVQLEGKKRMPTIEFIAGCKLKPGDQFI